MSTATESPNVTETGRPARQSKTTSHAGSNGMTVYSKWQHACCPRNRSVLKYFREFRSSSGNYVNGSVGSPNRDKTTKRSLARSLRVHTLEKTPRSLTPGRGERLPMPRMLFIVTASTVKVSYSRNTMSSTSSISTIVSTQMERSSPGRLQSWMRFATLHTLSGPSLVPGFT